MRQRSGSALAHADEGSGTMAGVALVMLVAVLLSAAATAGHLLVRRTVARSAADLAALSAAVARHGGGEPCVVAATVATAHAGRLASCEVGGDAGDDVTVRVALATDVPFMPEIAVEARAGPVPCDG
ncbi:Rv3654c family TadE-like protein [Bifidobacterium parmae]|uniref:Rv3654c family TadE-like protein n=1 Tax=Bifidobacterium parmae TaxID=361854 RepID=UPI0013FD1F8D|nr:Rv3654c family TadE-like protein [Bifidobacterium parmae]